ncbi:MAG: transcriptional repressor NrdR [Lachnospiraceae bacterium]|nr:transcriptional repressor NrdR [Lachnospiraceae bacterium]
MKCPYCGAEDTKVIDSRPCEGGAIRRRRQCVLCDKRFTTYERVEAIPLMVVKKDGVREEFDRMKIEKGMLRACHKRPVSADTISRLADEIENELMAGGEREIPSTVIGEMVMQKLKETDDVAYVRFASVYREFKDVRTFVREIEKMDQNPKN